MPADLKVFFQSLSDSALDPSKEADRRIYVKDLHRREDGSDLIEELSNQLLWDEGGGAYLFTGQRGTGKSTELFRLKSRLEDEGCEVFYLDIAEYMSLTSSVDAQDFLISVIGGFSEKIAERFGRDPAHRGYLERVWTFLHTEVKLEEIEATVPVGAVEIGLTAALRSDPDFKKRLQVKTRGHLARMVADARIYVAEAIKLVRQKSNKPDVRVVLIVDSIERIRGVGQAASEVFCSVHDLFSGQTDNIRFNDLYIVYTIPPYLLSMSAALGAYYSGGAVYALSSVHLYEKRSREVSRRGLAQMIEIVTRRFAGWAEALSQEQLEELARSSGGDIRDYFRLIRLCLTKANQRTVGGSVIRACVTKASSKTVAGSPGPAVTSDMLNASKAMLQRDMLPIAEKDLVWLKKIAASHDACLPDNNELATLARFFEGKLVLNYRNGIDWYDVHPLIREIVDSFQPS